MYVVSMKKSGQQEVRDEGLLRARDFSRFAAVALDLRSLIVPIGISTIQCNLLMFFIAQHIWVYIYPLLLGYSVGS